MADTDFLSLLTGAGSLLKASGTAAASAAQRTSLQYQASVARTNALLDQTKASLADQDGQIAVQNLQLKNGQTFGTQRANLAANGTDLGQGSANDILTSTKIMGQRDADQLQTNAMRTAWGYKVQAVNDTNNANALDAAASSISPGKAAAASLLGNATQVSSAWNTFSKATDGITNW
jgi:hypothetical protein